MACYYESAVKADTGRPVLGSKKLGTATIQDGICSVFLCPYNYSGPSLYLLLLPQYITDSLYLGKKTFNLKTV